MRKLLWAMALASAVSLGAAASAAAQDSVTGTGTTCVSPETCPSGTEYFSLTADATSGPSGQDPGGTVTWYERYLGGYVNGDVDVTCLAVHGKVAIIGVTGTATTSYVGGQYTRQTGGLIRVTDGGGPASGLDRFEFSLTVEPVPSGTPIPGPIDCSSFPSGSDVNSNVTGDLVVHDAPVSVRYQARQECIFIRAAHGRPAFRAWYGTPHAMRRCVDQRSSD
jgi:hypothetical protein